ncbi:MAG: hypothetical protein IJT64_03295 [Kiritimatiellae bacterium]|nr:hypothetical protein [Kiritimatiellia bacterium]
MSAFRGLAPALLALSLLALAGCVTNDDTAMPWAAPAPGEGTIPLPSSLLRE